MATTSKIILKIGTNDDIVNSATKIRGTFLSQIKTFVLTYKESKMLIISGNTNVKNISILLQV